VVGRSRAWRSLVVVGVVALALGVLSACGGGGGGGSTVTLRLGYVTPEQHPYGQAVDFFIKKVDELSDGKVKITGLPNYPGGDIPLLDAVKGGSVDMGSVSSAVWGTKGVHSFDALQMPFLLTNYALEGQVIGGDIGKEMLKGADAYGVVGLAIHEGGLRKPLGVSKKLVSLADFKGLKMRVGNSLARKIIAKAGATTVLTPASDIYAALERGVIDTAEWVGPHDDMKLGLHNTARYYYYPGWHEPGTMSEFTFNRKAYEALPVDLRQTLDHAAAAVQVYGLTDFHAKNAAALQRLKTEFKGKVDVLQFPVPVLRDLRKLAAEVIGLESEKTAMAKKVHASYTKFQALVGPWDHVADGAYHKAVGG